MALHTLAANSKLHYLQQSFNGARQQGQTQDAEKTFIHPFDVQQRLYALVPKSDLVVVEELTAESVHRCLPPDSELRTQSVGKVAMEPASHHSVDLVEKAVSP